MHNPPPPTYTLLQDQHATHAHDEETPPPQDDTSGIDTTLRASLSLSLSTAAKLEKPAGLSVEWPSSPRILRPDRGGLALSLAADGFLLLCAVTFLVFGFLTLGYDEREKDDYPRVARALITVSDIVGLQRDVRISDVANYV